MFRAAIFGKPFLKHYVLSSIIRNLAHCRMIFLISSGLSKKITVNANLFGVYCNYILFSVTHKAESGKKNLYRLLVELIQFVSEVYTICWWNLYNLLVKFMQFVGETYTKILRELDNTNTVHILPMYRSQAYASPRVYCNSTDNVHTWTLLFYPSLI